jgi:hypothetical protein
VNTHLFATMIGVSCAAIAWGVGLLIALVQFFALAPSLEAALDFLFNRPREENGPSVEMDLAFAIKALVLLPLITSGMLGLALGVCRRLRLPVAISVLLICLAGWWAYGAHLFSIGYGLAFGILAVQWLAIRRSSSFLEATYFIAFSHFVWCASLLGLQLLK